MIATLQPAPYCDVHNRQCGCGNATADATCTMHQQQTLSTSNIDATARWRSEVTNLSKVAFTRVYFPQSAAELPGGHDTASCKVRRPVMPALRGALHNTSTCFHVVCFASNEPAMTSQRKVRRCKKPGCAKPGESSIALAICPQQNVTLCSTAPLRKHDGNAWPPHEGRIEPTHKRNSHLTEAAKNGLQVKG